MDDAVAGTVAEVENPTIIGVRSEALWRILQSGREIQSLADTVGPRTGQRLYAKKDVVAAGCPSQNEVAVRRLEHGLGPGEQRIGRTHSRRQRDVQRRASIAIEVIGRSRDGLHQRN